MHRLYTGSLPLVVLVVAVIAIGAWPVHANPVREYGAGGRGLASANRLNYVSVMACLFELADINHDAALSEVELRLVLDRYVTSMEQLMDGLTPHRIIATCDTDIDARVSWDEAALQRPRCLTVEQVEGIAKWVCSRARHSDFTFDEYIQGALTLQQGFAEGHGLKTVAAEMMRTLAMQSATRKLYLARQAGVTSRETSTGAGLIDSVRKPVSWMSSIWAVPLIVLALVVACI